MKNNIMAKAIKDDMLNVLLKDAIVNGNLQYVQDVYEGGFDFNTCHNFCGTLTTPLQIAVEYGRCGIVNFIVNTNDKINVKQHDFKYYDRKIALQFAKQTNFFDIIKILTDAGAGLGDELISAIPKGDVSEIKKLIYKGAWVNAVDDNGNSVLILAVIYKQKDIVKILIKNGAKINFQDCSGWTALMHAAKDGQNEIVKYLIAKGANLEAFDPSGQDPEQRTARELAIENGHLDVYEILKAAGAGKDSDLSNAVLNGNIADVTDLLARGAIPNGRLSYDESILFNAVTSGNVEILRLLIYHKVDLNFPEESYTPLMHISCCDIIKKEHVKIADILIDCGMDVNIRFADQTALSLALKNKHYDLVELFKTCGALSL
jgi:ankyrin repeat protein